MNKKFIIIILSVLVSFKSVASVNVNGKGIYCKFEQLSKKDFVENSHDLHSAFAFSENNFVHILYKSNNEEVAYGINFQSTYSTTISSINLLLPTSNWYYDIKEVITIPNKFIRKNLVAKIANTKLNKTLDMSCNKYDNFKSLKNKLNDVREELQTEYNNLIKDNKL